MSSTAAAQLPKFYISKTKVVKPRDGEEEDTIILFGTKKRWNHMCTARSVSKDGKI